jgi:DNA-binding NarL/FixJ family response regulator
VRAVAAVESEGFAIEVRRLPLEKLLTDAEAYARTLPAEHPFRRRREDHPKAEESVLADPERIGQVLRNLLSNAAKYSPEGSPIELRVVGKKWPRQGGSQDARRGPRSLPQPAHRARPRFRADGKDEARRRIGVRVRAGGGVMAEEIRIMILDDHDTFRDPLAFMLEREPDLTVVARPRTLSQAREIVGDDTFAVDVALVDLNLPDGSGADLIKELRDARSRATALVLSATADRRHLATAIEAGAAGVMHKSAPMGDLVEAVRRLFAGEQLLSQEEVIEALRFLTRERESNREAQLASARLTPREREVLQALAEGSSDREIARRLHVGEGTVHSHVTNILSKLEVSSRLQALVFAVRHGVVTIE